MDRPCLSVPKNMLREAAFLEFSTKVRRTRTSKYDTVGGAVGEFILAEWLYGGRQNNHEAGLNKGPADFEGIIEIKTSIVPFSESLTQKSLPRLGLE